MSETVRTPDFEDSHEGLTLEQLEQTLRHGGIPIDDWGKGGAKTTLHLLNEIKEGETEFNVMPDGEVTRRVKVVWVDVFGTNENNEPVRLMENKQIFKDGRVRRRSLQASLGEKAKAGEESWDAAERALEEEIGVTNASLDFVTAKETEHTPVSYPGLKSYYDTSFFRAEISPESFKPDGYIEYQKDKTNYYVWRPLGRPTASS